MTAKYIIGSVSHGTMREEDLIPAFLGVLEGLDPAAAKAVREDEDNKPAFDWLEDPEANPMPDWLSDFLWETIGNKLDNLAPPYFYFGAHPGDGADYGFWLSEDFEQSFIDDGGLKVDDRSEVPSDYSGEVLHVNDHGNCTLYSAKDGKLTEVWAVA